MISFLRRYQKPLFIGVIAIFLIGTFVGLGGYLFTSNDTSGAVAAVGAVKIPYARYIHRVNQYLDVMRTKQGEVTEEAAKEVKTAMLRDMIVDELLVAKAEEMGLRVTDEELARDIRSTPAFQRGGQFDEDAYMHALRTYIRETPQVFETERRKTLLASKVKQMIFMSAKLAPKELEELYARENKGSMKDFEKKRAEFAQRAHQMRALELINSYLRQAGGQIEIRSYLEQRESGI